MNTLEEIKQEILAYFKPLNELTKLTSFFK